MEYEGIEIEDRRVKQKKKKSGLKRSEESIQEAIVKYIRSTYPDVIFRCAPDNIRMSIGQVMKSKRAGMIQRSLPDLELFHPSKEYHSLFLELKKESFKLRKADGELYKNEHVSEQHETLCKLRDKGYAVSFGVGFQHTKELIDLYMDNKRIEHIGVM